MNKQENKICQNCKSTFVIEDEDFGFYKKIDVLPPTWCPECRLIRRLVWRNERSLYKIKCNLCGIDTFSMYSPGSDFKIFCLTCWSSDKWDPMEYSIEFDFKESVFECYKKLILSVPRPALQWRNMVNSPFTNFVADGKNVYMSFSVTNSSENVYYSKNIDGCAGVFDSFDSFSCQNCYQNVVCEKNYNSIFLLNSKSCIDSSFLFDCSNCQNCFLSNNLRNKKFYIRNRQYTEGEYFEMMKNVNLGSYWNFQKIVEEFWNMILRNSVHKYGYLIDVKDCTGNDIFHAKNAKHTFSGFDFEDTKYVFRCHKDKDCMDITNIAKSETTYESMGGGNDNSSFVRFTTNGMKNSRDITYTDFCGSSSNLFACIGLRNKQYCILNKQYTKEEYEVLLPKIKQHMMDMPYIDQQGRVYAYGEFFPLELSPFAYNETIAQEYFPLTKEQALSQGFRWKDPDTKDYIPTILSKDLPDSITDVPDSITNEIIQCKNAINFDASGRSPDFEKRTSGCTRCFKIIPDELAFYRRMNLPLPRLCPNCRHYERLTQRNPLKLWHRTCQCAGTKSENGIYQNTATHQHGVGKCPNEFETSYSPERKEIVYCESCYQSEVV